MGKFYLKKIVSNGVVLKDLIIKSIVLCDFLISVAIMSSFFKKHLLTCKSEIEVAVKTSFTVHLA